MGSRMKGFWRLIPVEKGQTKDQGLTEGFQDITLIGAQKEA